MYGFISYVLFFPARKDVKGKKWYKKKRLQERAGEHLWICSALTNWAHNPLKILFLTRHKNIYFLTQSESSLYPGSLVIW